MDTYDLTELKQKISKIIEIKINNPLISKQVQTYKDNENQNIYLTRNNSSFDLSVLSPKYLNLLENILYSNGQVLCYSQFRNVEGVELFKLVLEANGYTGYDYENDDIYNIKEIIESTNKLARININGNSRFYNGASGVVHTSNPEIISHMLNLNKEMIKLDPDGKLEIDQDIWITSKIKYVKTIKDEVVFGFDKEDIKDKIRASLKQDGLVLGEFPNKKFVSTLLPEDIETEIDTLVNNRTVNIKEEFKDILSEDEKSLENLFLIVQNKKTKVDNERVVHLAKYGILDSTNKHELIKQQQSDENKYGQKIQVLFITIAGAEGFSFYNIRKVCIMEPFWNMVKIKQVIGRARRNYSHQKLPITQRNVRVYEYIGKFTKIQATGKWKKDNKENIYESQLPVEGNLTGQKRILSEEDYQYDDGLTSDESLQEISEAKATLLNSFLSTLKMSAIDCQYNHKENLEGDPYHFELNQCTNSKDFKVVAKPLESNSNFIRTPIVKYIPKKIIKITKKDIEEKNRKTININTGTGEGNFRISVLEIGLKIYDFYQYYGLVPKHSKKLEIIGEIKLNMLNKKKIILISSTFKSDLEKLKLYSKLEDIRNDITDEYPQYEIIGKSNYDILQFIKLFKQHQEYKEILNEGKIDTELKDAYELLQLDPKTVTKKELIETYKKMSKISTIDTLLLREACRLIRQNNVDNKNF